MANNIRPLDYFPFSVRFFEDRKIRRLQRAYKGTGLIIYIYLIAEIYKNGNYFLTWDNDYPEDVADAIDGDLTAEFVAQVVNECATKFGLFDKDLFEKGILTSKGIQYRILEIKQVSGRRKIEPSKVFPNYCLIENSEIALDCDKNNTIAVNLPQPTATDRNRPQEYANAVICDDLRENTENCAEMRPKLNKTKLNKTKLNINNTLQISNDGNLQPAAKEQNAETAESKTKKFVKPTIEELTGYVMAAGLPLNFDDVNEFMDYYTSKGWKVGREGMKDWQAALRNWSRRKGEYSRPSNTRPTETVTITDRQKINEEFLNGK